MTVSRLVRSPLLGVRLRDAVTLAPVCDGLELWLERVAVPGRLHRPVVGPSGIYAWHDLPGFDTAPTTPHPARGGWRLR